MMQLQIQNKTSNIIPSLTSILDKINTSIQDEENKKRQSRINLLLREEKQEYKKMVFQLLKQNSDLINENRQIEFNYKHYQKKYYDKINKKMINTKRPINYQKENSKLINDIKKRMEIIKQKHLSVFKK